MDRIERRCNGPLGREIRWVFVRQSGFDSLLAASCFDTIKMRTKVRTR